MALRFVTGENRSQEPTDLCCFFWLNVAVDLTGCPVAGQTCLSKSNETTIGLYLTNTNDICLALIMTRIRTLVVFSLLLSAAASAFASSWHFTWAGNNETLFFFDADTVEKNREITTVWVKIVRTNRPDTDGSWATAVRWRMNCTKRTIQTLASSDYDQDGKFMKSYPNPGKETEVIPDSTGESMLKIACAADFPKNKSNKEYFKIDNNDVFQATRNYIEYVKSQKDTAPQ